LNDEGYKHFKVNHSINFKDPDTNQHTNTIEGLWRHAKYSLPQYHKKKTFIVGYLSKFMFLKQCKALNIDPFTEFLRIAGSLYNPITAAYVDNDDNESNDDNEGNDDNEDELSENDTYI